MKHIKNNKVKLDLDRYIFLTLSNNLYGEFIKKSFFIG